MAPYGMLQSLTRDRDLDATLAEAAREIVRTGHYGPWHDTTALAMPSSPLTSTAPFNS